VNSLTVCDFDRPKAINSFQSIVILVDNMTDKETVLKINKAVLEELYASPMTQDDIAHLYCVSQATISMWFKKFDIPARETITDITREKQSKAKKGVFVGDKHHLFGTHLSEETKQKISESNIGKRHTEESKQMISRSLKGRKFSEEHKIRISNALKGKQFNKKGRRLSEETKQKISEAHKGKKRPKWIIDMLVKTHKGQKLSEETKRKITESNIGKHHTEETRAKMSASQPKRENSPHWRGGKKAYIARRRYKIRNRGFTQVVNKQPYNEPTEFHHIHPKLPYVIPCPTRIHKMFSGAEKSHHHNVNAMLGFKFQDV